MTERRAWRRTVGLNLAIVGLASIGVWQWWLSPWRAAARHADEQVERRQATITTLAQRGITTALDDRRVRADILRWRAPSECLEVYRIRVDEHYRDADVAKFLARPETHTTRYLGLIGDPRRAISDELAPVIGVLVAADHDDQDRVRQLWWGPAEVGPSAPDFACRRREWDPLEDALALGWPRLADADTWVGERWRGAAVEGRCHETVCLDPDGSFGHAIPCRAQPWSEQLIGADDELALVFGSWNDGHDPALAQVGIVSARELVIDDGRPLYVRAVIDHRWAGVRRELVLTRVDDCGARSLAAGPGPALAEIRARIQQAID